MYYIASCSFGKDSLAMILKLIEGNYPLNEVVFYNTKKEFKAIYDTRDRLLPLLAKNKIKYTELKPEISFDYKMLETPVKSQKTKKVHKYGYGWCGGVCRWGTTEKTRVLDKYAENRNAIVYVGIASDETKRLEKSKKSYKKYPLSDWGMTEKQCLDFCYKNGFYWLENDIRLYDILDRASCWCCRNKNLKELKNIYIFLPEYWNKLKELQNEINEPMKGCGKSVFDLEKRFNKERNKKNEIPI